MCLLARRAASRVVPAAFSLAAIVVLGLGGTSLVHARTPAAYAPSTVQRKHDDAPTPLPVRLEIPRLHIDARIVQVGFDDDGGMASPDSAVAVGWFAPGFVPGTAGNAVMAGHVDWVDHAAVFWFLKNLAAGDTITVVFDDDSSLDFVVDSVQAYDDTDTPMDQIFGNSDGAHLNLVTCGGVFDYATHNYDHRTVVYTTMVANSAPPAPTSD